MACAGSNLEIQRRAGSHDHLSPVARMKRRSSAHSAAGAECDEGFRGVDQSPDHRPSLLIHASLRASLSARSGEISPTP